MVKNNGMEQGDPEKDLTSGASAEASKNGGALVPYSAKGDLVEDDGNDELVVIGGKAILAKKQAMDRLKDMIDKVREQYGRNAAEYIIPIAKKDLGAALHLVMGWKKKGFNILSNRAKFTGHLKQSRNALSKIDKALGLEPDEDEGESVDYRPDLDAAHAVLDIVEQGEQAVHETVKGKNGRHAIVEALLNIKFDEENESLHLPAYFAQEGRVESLLRLLVVPAIPRQGNQPTQFDQLADAFEKNLTGFIYKRELNGRRASEVGRDEMADILYVAKEFSLDLIKKVAKVRKKGIVPLQAPAVLAVLNDHFSKEAVAELREMNITGIIAKFRSGKDSAFSVRFVTHGGEIETFNPHNIPNDEKERLVQMLPDLQRVYVTHHDDFKKLLEDLPEGMTLEGKVWPKNGQPARKVSIKGLAGKEVEITGGLKEWNGRVGPTDKKSDGELIFEDIMENLDPDFELVIEGAKDRVEKLMNGNQQRGALPGPEGSQEKK